MLKYILTPPILKSVLAFPGLVRDLAEVLCTMNSSFNLSRLDSRNLLRLMCSF
jgi:hypothetical protein